MGKSLVSCFLRHSVVIIELYSLQICLHTLNLLHIKHHNLIRFCTVFDTNLQLVSNCRPPTDNKLFENRKFYLKNLI